MLKLLKCPQHKEIFEVADDGKKCWIENAETFLYLGYKWDEVETIPFEELRKHPVGPTMIVQTMKTIVEGAAPNPIFYPKDDPQPENPYKWIKGLLTLNPLPTANKTIELGFNLILPFANLPSGWSSKGKIIARHIGNETGVIGYNIEDEPDCRKWKPGRMLEEYREMKAGTNLPVGCLLCGDIGCGWDLEGYTKKEWQQEWIEAGNQVDFLVLDVYPYREPRYQRGRTPLEEMEYFHSFFKENVAVPIIACIQAHNTYPDQIRPNPLEQVKFWVDRGYGYVVYPWNNLMKEKPNSVRGVIDMPQEWKEANKYKREV